MNLGRIFQWAVAVALLFITGLCVAEGGHALWLGALAVAGAVYLATIQTDPPAPPGPLDPDGLL